MNYCLYLLCSKCGERYSHHEVHKTCSCGEPLLPTYDLAKIARAVTKDEIACRPATMWRYREFLPVVDDSKIISLDEGYTPIIPLGSIGKDLGMSEVFVKDEGSFPGGTFKARGASVGITRTLELGIRTIGIPTAGNAGGAWAIYGARAGIEVYVVMPMDAPEINKKECLAFGAHLYLVEGLISDAGPIVTEACARFGWFPILTFGEPYRIEGKKTLGLEIAEQFGWEFPDVILFPTGGGMGVVAIWKAFQELREMGWVGGNGPRMVAVQSDGCAPVVKAFLEGKDHCAMWPNAQTRADGLRMPKPFADALVLSAIRDSGGCAVAVPDEDIYPAMGQIARKEGLLPGPEGAATFLALASLKRDGWIGKKDRVLLVNTATGLKYPQLIQGTPEHLEKGQPIRP